MIKFKCIIQYNGTCYNGFQSQSNGLTIETTFKKALDKITTNWKDFSYGGRTDAGVHALGQVVAFTTTLNIEEINMKKALNAFLPFDINVLLVKKVQLDFHSRKSAISRVYKYLFSYETPPIYLEPFIEKVKFKPIIVQQNELEKIFLGQHDFSRFQSQGSYTKTTIRHVKNISLLPKKHLNLLEDDKFFLYYELRIESNGFLYKMVRNIMGALIEVIRGKKDKQELLDFFNQKNDNYKFTTAKAKGLCLIKINYEEK